MKLHHIITACLFFINASLFAQDKIVFRDGKIVDGKVTEVTSSEIKYRKPEMPDGPTYTIPRRDVNSLIFKDGSIELINVATSGKVPKAEREVIKYKNRISATYFIPYVGGTDQFRLHTTFGLSYERRIASLFSIKFPFEMNIASYNQSFMVGFMPKFYFNKSKIVQGFAGPELLFGYAKDQYYNYAYNPYTGYYGGTKNRSSFVNSIAGNVGVSINPVERFNITMDMGLGANIYSYFNSNNTQQNFTPKFLFKLGLSMGYNF